MKKHLKWIVLSSILLFYSLLYLATTKRLPLDENFYKIQTISDRLKKDPFVSVAYECNTSVLCVYVKDTAAHNWGAVGDSACVYLKEIGFPSFTVAVVGRNNDTLSKTKCP